MKTPLPRTGDARPRKLIVLITVDTEDRDPAELVDDDRDGLHAMIYGHVDGACYGFPKIMELADRFHVKATFFVSVFEHGRYGVEAIRSVCQFIRQAGHDVELHTHPRWVYDHSRREMHRYSLSEQIEIVKEGCRLIEEWTGRRPIAHRAGCYGANPDTLNALRANGVAIDSSLFPGQPTCHLTGPCNRVAVQNGVLEVPVTGFYRRSVLRCGPLGLPRGRTFIKTDIDWATLEELLFFVEQAKRERVSILNLFLHSYSFLRIDRNYGVEGVDFADMERFSRFLEIMSSDPDVAFLTMRGLNDLYHESPAALDGSDFAPIIDSERSCLTSGLRIVKRALTRRSR